MDASSGGVSGGGTGGAAGYAFGHCTPPTPSSCTFEATCNLLGCGKPWSRLDSAGCLRSECLGDDDCGDEERCIAAALVAPGCHWSGWEGGCGLDEKGECTCVHTFDCLGPLLCVPVEIAPPQADCAISSQVTCPELWDAMGALKSWLQHPKVGATLKDAMQSCHDKLTLEAMTLGCE
ncbi:MAG: hypothetical protein KF718_12570 [Polyangiaceae bacterium]|nr:hypothetical protein [Polyangiaceae bacterium]